MSKQANWWNELDCNTTCTTYLKTEPIGVENGSVVGIGISTFGDETVMFGKATGSKGEVMQAEDIQVDAMGNSANKSVSREQDVLLGRTIEGTGLSREDVSVAFGAGPSVSRDEIVQALELQGNGSGSLGYAVTRGHEGNGAGHFMTMPSSGDFIQLGTAGGGAEIGEDMDGEGRDKEEKDHAGKKKRAELWQDAEMDALISAYRQIHLKLMSTGNKGRHIFKSANEKWTEVRNMLLAVGVDRQPKEIERKWSNLLTAFKQIADWNKQVGQRNYWELDEAFKREKTKAKELPASFRVQMFESMAEFLGDTGGKKSRQNSHCGAPTYLSLMGASENSDCCGGAASSGAMDVPLPLEKLSCHVPNRTSTTDHLERKKIQVVLVSTGSFNPPTYMHLRMFELARDALLSEGYEVIGGYMSPVNDAYAKKGLAPSEHRIKLCELACEDSSFIMVDPWEHQDLCLHSPDGHHFVQEAKQISYQRTLTVLRRVELSLCASGFVSAENFKVMLLCGADLLESFVIPGVWILDQVKTICHNYGVVCICRGGKDVGKLIFENDVLFQNKRNIIVVDELVPNNISSSRLRQNLARGLSVKYLTPDSVIEYIRQHKLYVNHSK